MTHQRAIVGLLAFIAIIVLATAIWLVVRSNRESNDAAVRAQNADALQRAGARSTLTP